MPISVGNLAAAEPCFSWFLENGFFLLRNITTAEVGGKKTTKQNQSWECGRSMKTVQKTGRKTRSQDIMLLSNGNCCAGAREESPPPTPLAWKMSKVFEKEEEERLLAVVVLLFP